jgi:hypothetical protein
MWFGQFRHEDEKLAGSGKAYEEEMEGLTVERLELKDVAQAFPLIQLKHKALTIAQWTTYVQRITDTDGGTHRGILAARNDQGVIYGMLQYEVRCNVEGICQMGAASLVACGLFQEQSVQLTAAMVKTLEQMALELGCQRVLIVVPDLFWRPPDIGLPTPPSQRISSIRRTKRQSPQTAPVGLGGSMAPYSPPARPSPSFTSARRFFADIGSTHR